MNKSNLPSTLEKINDRYTLKELVTQQEETKIYVGFDNLTKTSVAVKMIPIEKQKLATDIDEQGFNMNFGDIRVGE